MMNLPFLQFRGPTNGWPPLLWCVLAGLSACSTSETRSADNRDALLGLDSAALDAKFAQPMVAFPLPDSVPVTSTASGGVVSSQTRRPTTGDASGAASARAAGKVIGARPGAASVASARSDSISRAMVARMASAAGNRQSRSDTVRGIVTLTGTAPAVAVRLQPVGGGSAIQLSGMATSTLARLGGATVMARGMRITARDFVVAEFLVRSVNGAAVMDGVIEPAPGGWWLRPTDGSERTRLADLPATLRGREGSRVWIAMQPSPNAPRAAGVIGRR